MIHNILLIDKVDGSIVAKTRFWKIDFDDTDIVEFLTGWKDLFGTEGLAHDTPIFVKEGIHKCFHGNVGEEMILLLATDGRDEDRIIRHKALEGAARLTTALRGNSLGYIRDNLEDILGDLIFTRFKISFVGSGGVGKSTLLRLLFGKEPAPGGYVPTINVAVDSAETIQFGTMIVTLWDFAGQAVFQDLWSFYFAGTDVIFLITDSSFRNVMQTKTLLRTIKKEAPAVPLFIIANKQDLPESMKSEKIQRLLGAPTFAMVAVDKTRREEFIRFMLEVAAKTVGVKLPEMPISEMITVRRRTEEIDQTQARVDPALTGFEDVPFQEGEDDTRSPTASSTTTSQTGASGAQESSDSVVTDAILPDAAELAPRILHLLLLVQDVGVSSIAYHLDYSGEEVDINAVASLISALDSFGGIDGDPSGAAGQSDALETIEHEGNLVMVEKSDHFILALLVTNDNKEDEQRRIMSSLLVDIEEKYAPKWESWEGDLTDFETSMFDVLSQLPLCPISLDYVTRVREAGRALPISNREVGKAMVEVRAAIEGPISVGGLVRSIDLPREIILGCLQIMKSFGWIDFQVEVTESSVLKKVGEAPEDIVKAYGQVILNFINLCDGTAPLESLVKQLGVSLAPMKFVTQKLVLGGVLEVVA
jgi:small GTP-binding protein